MRKRIVLTLLIIGTIAGYTSGIYSVATRGDGDGCERSRWSQHRNAE